MPRIIQSLIVTVALIAVTPLALGQTTQPTKPTSAPTAGGPPASAPATGGASPASRPSSAPTATAPAAAAAAAGEGATLNLPPGQTEVPIIPQKIDDMKFAVVALDGKSIVVPDNYRGKLVLVIFWATWCPHCKEELQYWRKVHKDYREHGVEIVGLLQDANRKDATEEKAAQFIKDENIPWPNVYVDATDLAVQYGAATIPTSFVVDGDTGKVVAGRGSLRKDRLEQSLVALAARKKLEKLQRERAAATQPASGATASQPAAGGPTSSPPASKPTSAPTTRPATPPPTSAPASRPTPLPPSPPTASKPAAPPPAPSEPPAPKPLPPAKPPEPAEPPPPKPLPPATPPK